MEQREKEILLGKARQILNDLNSLSNFLIERKKQGDNFSHPNAVIFGNYNNILLEELRGIIEKLTEK